MTLFNTSVQLLPQNGREESQNCSRMYLWDMKCIEDGVPKEVLFAQMRHGP